MLRTLTLVVLLLSAWNAFAQDDPRPAGTKDTIVIIRRDTVFIVREAPSTEEETLEERRERLREERLRAAEERAEQYREQRSSTGIPRETPQERRERLLADREERYNEWIAWKEAQPKIRVHDVWAFKFYPSGLWNMDFPGLRFGVERTFKGNFGLMGIANFLTRPNDIFNIGEFTPGRPRYGIRGVELGLEGRAYLAESYSRTPFYIASELSFALAAVEFDVMLPVQNATFSRLTQVPINGQRIRLGFLSGWEHRTEGNLVFDSSFGLSIDSRGLFTSNERVQELVRDNAIVFNEPNTYILTVGLIARLGIGFGDWEPSTRDSKSSKGKSSKGKSSRKRR